MVELFSFFIIISAGLFFSSVFGRFRIPWVIALIVTGFIIGPFGLDLFAIDVTIDFFSRLGLIFLMFLTGLEIKLATLRERRKEIFKISVFNAGLPFLTGFLLLTFWGYGVIPSLLFGIIFISSSVAVIAPFLHASGLVGTKTGDSIMAAVLSQDILSLLLLSLLIQSVAPISSIPLFLLYPLLFLGIFVIRYLVPKMRWLISHSRESKKDFFEREFRSVLVILLGVIIFFELLGLHAIIAAFLAGLVLSDFIKSHSLREKLHVIGYGVFIPIFFIVIGMDTDLGVFKDLSGIGLFLFLVVAGSIASKFIGGFVGARLAGFDLRKTLLVGSATIPQLSTTLAAVFVGFEAGILNKELVTAMVFLSMITTFTGPILSKIIMPGSNQEILESENKSS